jgi:hypothetical protein
LAASGVESSDDTALIRRGENLLVSVALHDREEAYALETVYYKNIVLISPDHSLALEQTEKVLADHDMER